MRGGRRARELRRIASQKPCVLRGLPGPSPGTDYRGRISRRENPHLPATTPHDIGGVAMRLTINGKSHEVDVDPTTPLLWVIREQVGLTGTKYGCGVAQCGACTVHMNGLPVRSCSIPVSAASGAKITTIEGLALACAQCHDDNWGKRLAGSIA